MRVPHARAVGIGCRALEAAFGKLHWIRNQLPPLLPDSSEPEPDLVVVKSDPRDTAEDHPRTALAVVENSESTLEFDRAVKRQLYAEAGIPEYWIINLTDRWLEDFPQPIGSEYQDQSVLSEKESITPQSAVQELKFADLLP